MSRGPVRGWLAAFGAALVLIALPFPDWIVERFYSRGIFPYLQAFITTISNLVPLALLDLMLLALVVVTVFRLFNFFVDIRRVGVQTALVVGLQRLIRAASLLTIAFVMFWGLNYRRTPLEHTLGAPVETPSIKQLEAAVSDANALAARLRPAFNWATDEPSYENAAKQLREPFNNALQMLRRPLLTTPGRPKYSLILTPFFTWAGVTGMVNPLALESIVHPDLLPFERPFVLAHEWGHLAGLADEADASAVGWLACMQGGAVTAYSASLYLILEAGAALPPPNWRDARQRLDPAIQADLAAIARRMQREKPVVRRAAFQVYDRYLKANRVDDGVASYSRALSLILSAPLHESLSTYRINK